MCGSWVLLLGRSILGNQPWVFIGRTDAEAETPIFRPPDEKSWLIGKDPDAGRDWGQEEKGMTEDEMAGWHRQLMDMSLSELRELVMDREAWHTVCRKELDTTEGLNWTEESLIWRNYFYVTNKNIHSMIITIQSWGWMKTVLMVLKKSNPGFPNITVIPLLDIYPKELGTGTQNPCR